MTKKEQLLKKLEEQQTEYENDLLLDVKEKFAKNIKLGIEKLSEDLTDEDYDILLKENNLIGKLLSKSIVSELEFTEYQCGWQNIEGYLNEKRFSKRHTSDEEM
ncbi:MAG: hypothetical protein NC087_05240 [Anaeroplasma bactoclasticum]|nr:hypothetical protein [Anaeroplasma bactoclasticum]